MTFIVRPAGSTDKTTWEEFAEGTLPQEITRNAGDWEVARRSDFSAAATVTEAAASFFTMTGTGPYYRDPSPVPANTTAIEYAGRIRIPTAVALSANTYFATKVSTGMDLQIVASGGPYFTLKVEDGLGAAVYNGGLSSFNKGEWLDFSIVADHAAAEVRSTINGVAQAAQPFTAASNGSFESTREVMLFAFNNATGILHAGIEVEFAEIYFTTAGTRSLRKRIDASNWETDPWRDDVV